MDNNICNICGAPFVYKNGKWVCPACGAYKPEELSNEEDTLYYNASQALRLCNFDDAETLFRDIVSKYPATAKNYWGLLLSKYGIKYETDYDGKKIPTCYAASYESLYKDSNYKKALSLASKDEKEYYEKQAEIIEANRIEWVEKASKQAPVDIFISYKDTELENGIERTRDSYEAYELYVYLTKKGYNVFYSRESLKSYGEKYEPYIFNALNTAKVMIVFGTKPEYITSTWIKNEWTRFAKKIKAKEKAPNSLILLYHGFNPSDLPAPLRNIQSIDVNSITWMTSLDEYILDVVKNTPSKKVSLKKTTITPEIGKKIKPNIVSPVSDHIIGAQYIEGTTYTSDDKLNIADKFIDNGIFDQGLQFVNKVLETNPNDGQALFRKFLCLNKLKSIDSIKDMNILKITNLDLIDQAVKHSNIVYAQNILNAFYDYFFNIFANTPKQNINSKVYDLCSNIILYEYNSRASHLDKLLGLAVEKANYNLLNIVLKVAAVDDVDKLCYWLEKMLTSELGNANFDKAKEIATQIIAIDEGNNTARRAMIRIETLSMLNPSVVSYDPSIDKLKSYENLKNLLRFENVEQQKKEIEAIIRAIPIESLNLDFYTELLKFYPDDVGVFIDPIVKKGNFYLVNENYGAAKYLFQLLTTLKPKEAKFYFYIILAKAEAKDENELIFKRDILTFDEYIPMLNNANEDETKFFLDIVKKQRKFKEEEIEFKNDAIEVTSLYNERQKLHKKMEKCEKTFNYCNKNTFRNKFPKGIFIAAIIFTVLYFVVRDIPIIKDVKILPQIMFFIMIFFCGLFVIFTLVFIIHKIIAKCMFKKFAKLRTRDNDIEIDAANYKNKYTYYKELIAQQNENDK